MIYLWEADNDLGKNTVPEEFQVCHRVQRMTFQPLQIRFMQIQGGRAFMIGLEARKQTKTHGRKLDFDSSPRPSPRLARRGRIILWDDLPRAALPSSFHFDAVGR